MKRFRLLLLGSTIIASAAAGSPALAVGVIAPDDFSLSVSSFNGSCSSGTCFGSGSFTVTNNTSEWYITGFTIDLADTNINSANASIDGSASFPVSDWFTCNVTGVGCGSGDLGLQYYNFDGGLTEDLGNGTWTGFDYSVDYAESEDPPVTFDLTNGIIDTSCTGNIGSITGSGNTASCDAATVPEPASLSLFGAGLAFLALRRRRRAA